MNFKNIKWNSGIMTFILGIILLFFALYGVHSMNRARGVIENVSNFIHDNSIKGLVKGKLHHEADKYKLPITLAFIGSGICIIAGGVLIYLGSSKRRKK